MSENSEAIISEIRQRCINIETKIDQIARLSDADGIYRGHADQHFGAVTYAQHGDDLVAINIFHNIGIKRPSYLDIGAHHPLNISNTALFYALGCRGINVEPNPNLIENFHQMRPEDINLNVGISDEAGDLEFYMIDEYSGRNTFDKHAAELFVNANPQFSIRDVRNIPVKTIDGIVQEYAGGIYPDFLSLDVEGMDLRILRSMSHNLSSPKVICVEYISGDSSNYYPPIKDILNKNGYTATFKTIGNAFFVLNEYVHLL